MRAGKRGAMTRTVSFAVPSLDQLAETGARSEGLRAVRRVSRLRFALKLLQDPHDEDARRTIFLESIRSSATPEALLR